MTWEEIRQLSGGHVIAAHTATHQSGEQIRTPADVEQEILAPRRAIERATGQAPAAIAFLDGAGLERGSLLEDAVTGAGYRYVFSNTKIQRVAEIAPLERR